VEDEGEGHDGIFVSLNARVERLVVESIVGSKGKKKDGVLECLLGKNHMISY
jgi:hypothetical protein